MTNACIKVTLTAWLSLVLIIGSTSTGQTLSQESSPDWLQSVLAEVNATQHDVAAEISAPWWRTYVATPIRTNASTMPTDVNSLLHLALTNSAQLQVYSEVPLIRETAIQEADAAFDWTAFVDSIWEDISEPVGNTLTVGGTGTRFNDHNFNVSAGVRKRMMAGGRLEMAQRLGHQNTNSNFFLPNDQGTARLTLSYTQPLLRGRGKAYNTSLTVLAKLDSEAANDEFLRQLQTHLQEVARGYWALYLERGAVAQRSKLYVQTKRIYQQLKQRRRLDAQRSTLASAEAAFTGRRADLIRAQAAVKNAESRLRALVNAEQLGDSESVELIPQELPTLHFYEPDFYSAFEMAVRSRPEIRQAVKNIKAGCVRLNMAKHEMMPVLDAVTQVYVAGLQGQSDVGEAWTDQFTRGAPSYTAGLQLEVPIWNRAADARLKRRRLEVRRLQAEYRSSLELVKTEVDVAVREVNTSFREMSAKHQAMTSARLEAETLQTRWDKLATLDGNAALVLEDLLRSQERATSAEFDFLTAQLTYSLSLMNLKRATGVLLEVEGVNVGRTCVCNLPTTVMDKSGGDAVGEYDRDHVDTVEPLPMSSDIPHGILDTIEPPIPGS